jgi:uncharacterized protein YecT (DUF1311 family)
VKKIIIIIFVIVCSNLGNAQGIYIVEKMADDHQACLDKGYKMLQCAIGFYYEMDSMLNVVYTNLRKKVTTKEKEKLKKEQNQWLKRRDVFFKKENKIALKNWSNWGEDADMFAYDNKADFVKRRVIELIKRLKSN